MSQPTSPQSSPRKGKYLLCKVLMLDDCIEAFQVPYKALGHALYDAVVRKLQLLESDYFDLEFVDNLGVPCWLDHDKHLAKQVDSHNAELKFLVKFYSPDPVLLEDEFTRYLFALQVRRDLITGAMLCQEHTAVLLASYIVQAEIGDFMEDEYSDYTYLSTIKMLPNQNPEIEIKIMEHHREHIGQTPAEAEFNLLDTARKVEMYGIRMHPAKDHENVQLHLSTAHMGVLVFQNYTKINTFSWAKIRKLSFKRKKFLIKLHPEGYGYYKDTVEFYFDNRNECKNFWKKCIEHHAFFRCHTVKRLPRNKTRVMSRGSSFRYSGRTQKQLVEYIRDNYVKHPPFERTSTSMRTVSTMRSAAATPKTGTLNSRDIHFGHNISTSSGSHTLDMGRSYEKIDANRVEAAEVYNENSIHRGRQYAPNQGPRDAQHMNDSHRSLNADVNNKEPRGVQDEFNYSYYQISYDSGHHLANQNANDNDDNISHDSYNLHEESRESVERELEPGEEFVDNTILHIDEDKLMRELEKEKERRESYERRETLEIHSSDSDGSPRVNGHIFNRGNDIHIVRVDDQTGRQDKRVEIQIVEKIERTKIYEKVEKRSVIENMSSCESMPRKPHSDSELDGSQPSMQEVRVELIDTSPLNACKVGVTPPRKNSNDIPYILHRRHLAQTAEQNSDRYRSNIQSSCSFSTFKSPSLPPFSHHASREQQKIEMERIKTSLSSPIISPQKSPMSPSEKSPGITRAFDFVVVNRLPSRDSFSSKDDSLSPSLEKEIMARINEKKERQRKMNATNNSFYIEGSDRVLNLSELIKADGGVREISSTVTTPNSESDNELVPLRLEGEEDVNRVLSECGDQEDSSSVSSVSVDGEEGRRIVAMAASEFTAQLEERIGLGADDLSDAKEEGATASNIEKGVRTFGDRKYPPPPPYMKQASCSTLPIPAIIIKAASDMELSSSEEKLEERPPPPPVPKRRYTTNSDPIELYISESPDRQVTASDDNKSVDVRPKVRPLMRFKNISSSSSSDDEISLLDNSSLPPPSSSSRFEISSDSDMEEQDIGDDYHDAQMKLEALAQANPYSVPIRGDEHFPAPPDISSESDREGPDLSDLHDIHCVLDAAAAASPYSLPIRGDEHFPAPPYLSSESGSDDDELKEEFHVIHGAMAAAALANPYSVPIGGDEHFPAPPYLSSESSSEAGDLREEMMDIHAVLEAEALANPFSVPVSGDIHFPAPPEISSESDREDALHEECTESEAILKSSASANPFHVPLGAEAHFPAPPDISESDSDESNYKCSNSGEVGLSEMAAILASEAQARPYQVPLAHDTHFPTPYAHDISSESDVEQTEIDDLSDASHILQQSAAANPFSVPLPSTILMPLPEDSSSSSDSNSTADVEEEGPDVADILDASVLGKFRQKSSIGSIDGDLPPPPPPPPLSEEDYMAALQEDRRLNEFYRQLSLPESVTGNMAIRHSSTSSSSGASQAEGGDEADALEQLERLGRPPLCQNISSSDSDEVHDKMQDGPLPQPLQHAQRCSRDADSESSSSTGDDEEDDDLGPMVSKQYMPSRHHHHRHGNRRGGPLSSDLHDHI